MFSCSKSKEKKDAEAAQAGKTVDLGEALGQGNQEQAADADEIKGDTDVQAPKERGKRPRRGAQGQEAIDDQAIADRNAAEGVNDDGTAKRGEPAEAHNAADAADNVGAVQAEVEDGKFDFVAQDEERKQNEGQARPRRSRVQDLSIEAFINIREFREQTGYAGLLTDAELLGQTPDARYLVMRLATDDPKQLGFSIQVWKPGNESAAAKRFDDLYAQSFGGTKTKDISSDAYASSHHQINELAFLARAKRVCVLLSCSDKICTPEQMRSIAQLIARRL